MAQSLQISAVFPVSAETMYNAWLDSESHSAMTGAEASITPKTGDTFSAWDGYISGVNLELIPGKRIFQRWRTSEFGDQDPDSKLLIELESIAEGVRINLTQTDIPEGQPDYKRDGKIFTSNL